MRPAIPLLLLCAACGTDPGGRFADSPLPGKSDLPNQGIYDREYDGTGYAAIARHFKQAGFDVTADPTQLDSRWPIREEHTAVLDRYGTPILLSGMGYFHTGLDIYRTDTTVSDEVLAPISGKAWVSDWSGNFTTPGGEAYSTVISIWDPRSHLVVQLMHVRPAERLYGVQPGAVDLGEAADLGGGAVDLAWRGDDGGGAALDLAIAAMPGSFIDVMQGEPIAHLATLPFGQGTPDGERMRHTHVDVVDGEHELTLNPAHFFQYHDQVAPTLDALYFLDDKAARSDSLKSGKLDIVVQVHDRDEASPENLEIGSIAYELRSADGTVLRTVPRCYFEHLFESTKTTGAIHAGSLLDFGDAKGQISGSWPGADVGNPDRTFRYALTQFTVDAQGRCGVLDDKTGFFDVTDDLAKLQIHADVWDQTGNVLHIDRSVGR